MKKQTQKKNYRDFRVSAQGYPTWGDDTSFNFRVDYGAIQEEQLFEKFRRRCRQKTNYERIFQSLSPRGGEAIYRVYLKGGQRK
jgi:hypothetical protein